MPRNCFLNDKTREIDRQVPVPVSGIISAAGKTAKVTHGVDENTCSLVYLALTVITTRRADGGLTLA